MNRLSARVAKLELGGPRSWRKWVGVDPRRWPEEALLAFPGCAVVISHDRWFLDRVATHILAWEGDDEDQAQWFWFEGNFADYEANKLSRLGAEAARPHRATHRRLTR